MNGILTTKDGFFAFISKYERSFGRNLKVEIARPNTSYNDENISPPCVCWYFDNSYGNDPQRTGRDYYIREDFVDFKTPEEQWELLRADTIANYPVEMTAITQFMSSVNSLDAKDWTAETYMDFYKDQVNGLYEKLFPEKKNKPTSVAKKAVQKKTVRKAPVKKTAKRKTAKRKTTKR